MKAEDVLNLLKITRPILTKYVKDGIIKVKKLPTFNDLFQLKPKVISDCYGGKEDP